MVVEGHLIPGMLRARAVLDALALLVFVYAVSGCYDECDHKGEVRCSGSVVEKCGYLPGDQLSWDNWMDCGELGAQCGLAKGSVLPTDYCVVPEITCHSGPLFRCRGFDRVFCSEEGAAARWEERCSNTCREYGDDALCIASATDAGP